MRHRNIPIFIPHMGCPNQCVFCNQHSIATSKPFALSEVRSQIEAVLRTVDRDDETEIAFFGGSFTGIDRALMISLLEIAQEYVKAGSVLSIRLSTRPDYINAEILRILSRYSVKSIELGLQSMSDRVLTACRRGHTAKDAENACRAIVGAGFSLVGQMMIGLPQSSLEDEVESAERICALGAEAARIYPTVVFYGTPLCEMAKRGEYTPLTLEGAIKRSAAVMRVFDAHRVPCIRIGLCANEGLTDPKTVYAGPNHPALGELVMNDYYYEKCKELLTDAHLLGQKILLRVPTTEVSKVVGQHRSNIIRLRDETDTRVMRVIADEKAEVIYALPWQKNERASEEITCI